MNRAEEVKNQGGICNWQTFHNIGHYDGDGKCERKIKRHERKIY